MSEQTTEKVQDIENFEEITNAVVSLVNKFPVLSDFKQTVKFNVLDDKGGLAIFPTSGAVIISDTKDILGRRTQECNYGFMIVFRAGGLNECRRATLEGFLNNCGRWLEKQPIQYQDKTYTLEDYPTLTLGREFDTIKRASTASCINVYDNQIEDWAISINARYICRS